MLKRLELVGFKSFADRTRFDFAPGITAIVGPNGSGKSNVVDAVKWILGEQSAKSLRGGEMADVIFNGSATRKSFGMAEVTMTFDNAKKQLQFEGDDVQITRRVYRDGQGEYLINGVVSRLKDIKEMFLGSGAGHGAYSIIEQGRVDALLVASTKDRRQIFEEAAGISRFRSRKLEALRKLEAAELNLNRVKDILQELEKALKTLQNQAAKAKKYQEYQTRLKDLRLGLGLRESHELAETLEYQQALLSKLQQQLHEAAEQLQSHEDRERALEAGIARVDEAIRAAEKWLGEARQAIAGQEAAAKSQREQSANLETEALRIGRQRADLVRKLQTLAEERDTATQQEAAAIAEADGEGHRAEAAAAALQVASNTIAELARQVQAAREEQFARVGRAAQLNSAAEVTSAQVERLRRESLRKQAESEKAAAEAEAIRKALTDLNQDTNGLQNELSNAKRDSEELTAQQNTLRKQAADLQPKLDEARDRRGDLRGRADLLEQLERSFEGIGAGVRAVLEKSQAVPGVHGIVADLLAVPQQYAPLIDLVLGDAAQQFVVEESELANCRLAFGDLPGRVGFIPLRANAVPSVSLQDAISPRDFVSSPLPGLVEQLLGNVFLVDSFDAAMDAWKPGLRVITIAGELINHDGTLVFGARGGDAGILSRKSELRDLKTELAALEDVVKALETEQNSLRSGADRLDAAIAGRNATIAAVAARLGDLRDAIAGQREKQSQLQDLLELLKNESVILSGELGKADTALTETRTAARQAEAAAEELKATLAEIESQLKQSESNRETRQRENTEAQVALGRARQKAAALASRRNQLESEQRERAAEAVSLAELDNATHIRQLAAALLALNATQTAAQHYSDKELAEAELAQALESRESLRRQRDQLLGDVKAIRDDWKTRQDQAHAHELTLRDLTNRRESIAQRIREDYAVELADAAAEIPPLPADLDDEAAQNEIDDLKKKIAKLGSVNLEALEQLAAEEAREQTLRTEFADLTAARNTLLEIIETINTDSRRLFNETLNVVRVHFQELFRKLFGGGMADIVLEDPLDVLETGIEITARPPGKELRSISLLSGGEKTLTAVALLLAIFRSRPSPFCLLDEVDAALDEANTARLSNVLREFLDQSQFIIITHKKRTMAMADVLYGITMQESGISKQVATRIEDWPDETESAAA